MSQYLSVKREYPDAILLFRLGDFYEMFYDDAKVASEILGIALTSRGPFEEKPSAPLRRSLPQRRALHIKTSRKRKEGGRLRTGGRPQAGKGIVERKVVRVLTPGAVLDSENLESKSNNFLACVAEEENGFGLSFCDISTGEFRTSFFRSPAGSSLRACARRPEGDTHPGFRIQILLGLNPCLTRIPERS